MVSINAIYSIEYLTLYSRLQLTIIGPYSLCSTPNKSTFILQLLNVCHMFVWYLISGAWPCSFASASYIYRRDCKILGRSGHHKCYLPTNEIYSTPELLANRNPTNRTWLSSFWMNENKQINIRKSAVSLGSITYLCRLCWQSCPVWEAEIVTSGTKRIDG